MLQNFQTIDDLTNLEMLGIHSRGLSFVEFMNDENIHEFDDDELLLYNPDDDDDDEPGGPEF